MELPIRALDEAAAALLGLVARIEPDQWNGPGLGEWDLRALVGHATRSLITIESYLDRPAARAEISGAADYYRAVSGVGVGSSEVLERGRAAGVAMGPEPVTFVAALVERVTSRVGALSEVGADPVIESIVGAIALSDYLPTRTFELVVHGLDVAAAADLPVPELGPALAEATALASQIAVRGGHGPTVLMALTGRGSLPRGFSVV